jgi:hypothetical protein
MRVTVPVLQYHNEVLIHTLITGHGIVIIKQRSAIDDINSSVQTEGCRLRILIVVPDGV